MGNVPLKAVSMITNGSANQGVGELHGKPIDAVTDGFEFVLYPIYHPASLIYNPENKSVYEQDLLRLGELVENFELKA